MKDGVAGQAISGLTITLKSASKGLDVTTTTGVLTIPGHITGVAIDAVIAMPETTSYWVAPFTLTVDLDASELTVYPYVRSEGFMMDSLDVPTVEVYDGATLVCTGAPAELCDTLPYGMIIYVDPAPRMPRITVYDPLRKYKKVLLFSKPGGKKDPQGYIMVYYGQGVGTASQLYRNTEGSRWTAWTMGAGQAAL